MRIILKRAIAYFIDLLFVSVIAALIGESQLNPYYEKQKKLREQYMREFTAKFGPISAYDVNITNKWTWIDNPWPWERMV